MIALGIVLIITTLAGILLVIVGWLGMTRRLPPNPIAGIRTTYTFSSDEAWYETHAFGGPILILGGTAAAAIGLALLPFTLMDSLPEAVVTAGILAQAIVTLVAAIASWLYGVRKAKQYLNTAPPTRVNGAPNAS